MSTILAGRDSVLDKGALKLVHMLRLDFTLRDSEFLFGELTFTHTGGERFTEYSDQYFERYWQEFCPKSF